MKRNALLKRHAQLTKTVDEMSAEIEEINQINLNVVPIELRKEFVNQKVCKVRLLEVFRKSLQETNTFLRYLDSTEKQKDFAKTTQCIRPSTCSCLWCR